MIYRSGGIYLIKGKEENRPVVVLEQTGNKLRVIPVSSKKNIRNHNAWIMRTLIKETPVIVALKCDDVFEIPTSFIITQLGQISLAEMEEVRNKVGGAKDKKETLDTINTIEDEHVATIDDEKVPLWEDHLIRIEDLIKQINSPKDRWKERGFGFFAGLIASGIVAIITELLKNFQM